MPNERGSDFKCDGGGGVVVEVAVWRGWVVAGVQESGEGEEC